MAGPYGPDPQVTGAGDAPIDHPEEALHLGFGQGRDDGVRRLGDAVALGGVLGQVLLPSQPVEECLRGTGVALDRAAG